MVNKKSVIFFGRTGTGKSTLANMVLQGKLLGNNIDTFKSDSGVLGVSLECKKAENDIYCVYDTVGLGETDRGGISDNDAKKSIIRYLTDIKTKFDHICIVMKRDRISSLDFAVFNAARFIFDGAFENAVLIVTDATDAWLEENRTYLSQVYGSMNKCAVDFPPISRRKIDEDDNVRTRNKSLAKLNSFLLSVHTIALPPKICYESDTKKKEFSEKLRKFMYEAFAMARTIASVAILVLNILGLAGIT